MDGQVIIGTKLDTKDFDAEIKYVENQLEEIEHKLKQADMGFEVGDTSKLEAQYSKLNKQLDKLRQKQAQLNRSELNEMQKSISSIGESTSKTIKSIGKWALAVFGVRSAYMFVRQAASTLAEYNEQIAFDLEYIRFALASSMEPLVKRLISLTYTLLTYINYISKAWFGVDLFANASAESMKKGAKSAEKMKKSLAGFDEMNILSDNSSAGASAGTPSANLQAPKEAKVPSWIKWIADNKEEVIGGLLGIAAGIIAVNFGLAALQGLGIGIILTGVAIAIQGIVAMINDPSWQNFLTILEGIALVVAGVAILMGGWVVALVALGVALVAAVIKNWDKIKGVLSKVWEWIETYVVKPVVAIFKALFETVWSYFKFHFSLLNAVLTTISDIIAAPFIVAFDTIKTLINNLKEFFVGLFQVIKALFTGDIKGVLEGFRRMFKSVLNSLWAIAKAPINLIIEGINALISGLNKIQFDVPDWVPKIGGKKLGFNIKKIPRLAVGGIINMPNRGIPVGNAIAGESGREGVLPLTNSQAMMELGREIGKYITINANITNSMNGRVISRELQRVANDSDFAFNR